jgi:hypothetical protein
MHDSGEQHCCANFGMKKAPQQTTNESREVAQRRKPSGSTIQLLGLLVLASSGVILSSIVFHWKQRVEEVVDDLSHFHTSTPPLVGNDHIRAEPIRTAHLKKDNQPTLEECLAINSQAWVKGPRVGNSKKGHITFDTAMEMILNSPALIGPHGSGSIHNILKQTICHEQSRFLNYTDDGSEGQKSLNFWALRLLYLSFHIHQHKEATAEAKLRQKLGCDKVLTNNGFGTFDFECPKAKFLVVPMGEMGLGAVMRLGAVNALFAGMATNRTVLLINNVTVGGEKALHKPWVHASCERGDIQCFFMPPTPCTVTEAELSDAHVMARGEARRMFKFGEMPPGHEEDRVIISNFILRPKHTPPGFLPAILNYSDAIIQHVSEATDGNDPRIAIMEKSKEAIADETPFDKEKKYYYFGVESQPHHAAVFYAMRPNPFYAEKLEEILNHIFPEDFNPELSFGLPIRASDKCLMESECLAFPQYMKLMGQIWKTHEHAIKESAKNRGTTDLTTSIILTTESQSVLRDKVNFEKNDTLRASVPFSYKFITNEHDVMQSTGLPSNFMKNTGHVITSDEIMLSAMSSLKAQLMAKFTVGNCCSNFHLLLFDFLQDGCGAAKDNIGQCLQDNDDPEFRVCCMWSKSDECKEKSDAKNKKKADK